MSDLWTPLRTELGRWRDAGLVLPLWWRDDDAVADTPALRRLAAITQGAGLPLHLAVIPAGAGADLAAFVGESPGVIPMVHGLAHRNHAPEGRKKAEFGADRPLPDRMQDAREGLDRLRALFGDRLAPVFVPPWNRIGDDLVPELAGLGYRALSTFGAHHVAGLPQVNTHLDPIDWKGARGLIDPARLVAQMAADLARLRAHPGGPYGILTHHLVHDAEIWSFCEDLAAELARGPIHAWNASRDLT